MPLSTVTNPTIIAYFGTSATGHPYRFGGKELITANGLNEYDFGARQYYSALPAFPRIDPMAEKYPWLSPYLYCANDPINFVDPTGMFIIDENKNEWNRNRTEIEKRRDGIQKSINNIYAKGAEKEWSQDKIDKKIGDKLERVASLNNTLSTMTTLENSEQGYSLSQTEGMTGELKMTEDNIINISYMKGGLGNFVHEVTHAGQVELNEIFFNDAKMASYIDIYDELKAYVAQYAYEPSSIGRINPTKFVNSFSDINMNWLTGITDFNGSLVYGNNIGVSIGRIPVNRYSDMFTILSAYPSNKALRGYCK